MRVKTYRETSVYNTIRCTRIELGAYRYMEAAAVAAGRQAGAYKGRGHPQLPV